MHPALKILLFIIVNAVGLYILPLLANLAILTGAYPDFTPGSLQWERFNFWMYGIGTWLWIAAALTSIGFFFTQPPIRYGLLAAPIFVPLLFGIITLSYFNAFYQTL